MESAALDAPVQNNSLEPAEFRVFSGELPEAGKAPVSGDDPAVVQYHARLPLLHELDVGRGFADGVGIALHNEALDDLVVRLPVRRFRGLPAVLGPVLADPCGDAVVLVVVVELVQLDPVHRVGLGRAVHGKLPGQRGLLRRVLGQAVPQ